MPRGKNEIPVIKELLFDRSREQYVDWRTTPCPDDVELDTVASWLEQRYGPAINASWTVTEDVGEVPIGWVYEVPADWPSVNRAEQEMVAVPMLVDVGGEPTDSPFLVQAELRARLQDAAKQAGVEMTVTTITQRPYEASRH
jgi:hypothetical protein